MDDDYTLNLPEEDAELMRLWIDEDPYDLCEFDFDINRKDFEDEID